MKKILITLTLLMSFAGNVFAALTTTFEEVGNFSATVDTQTTSQTVAVGDVVIMVVATNKKQSVATVAFTSTSPGSFTELDVATLAGGTNTNPDSWLGYMTITSAGTFDFTATTSVLAVTATLGFYKLTADSGQVEYLDEAFSEWGPLAPAASDTPTDALSWSGSASYGEIGIIGVASSLRGLLTNTSIDIGYDKASKRIAGNKTLSAGATSFNNVWNITNQDTTKDETGGSLSIAFAEIMGVTPTYTIGGTISGLDGSVTLLNNGGDSLTTATNGDFTFGGELDSGATYNVTVSSQPATQECTVGNGSGTATADVTDITVTCADLPTYSIGGTISGLSGSVTLQNNGGDSLTTATNGDFTFANELLGGETYLVTVSNQPATQTCTVGNDSGTATADVTDITVTCEGVTKYSIGGDVSGLSGSVTLQNNGGDNLVRTADGSFTFAKEIVSDETYLVTVSSQPATQDCTVSNGSGTATADVTDVAVACVNVPTYSIGGNISGLTGDVTLQNNGEDDLDVDANGGFTFDTPQKDGSTYLITVSSQPSGQRCSVTSGGAGTVDEDNVIDVVVFCEERVIPPTGPVESIPTLSQWALILLSTLLGFGVFTQRRRLFSNANGVQK